MSSHENPAEGSSEPASAPKKRSRGRTALMGLFGVVALLVGFSLAGVGDIIDLPAWANINGVDVPLIGDTDAIDCRLRQIDGTTNVEITLVDGDESTYDQYVHVWNNGDLVAADELERPALETIISSSTDGADEQFYAVSLEPIREGRVFCESLFLER